ncbi:hypothetical protein N9L92_00320 [Saprospiraceae bacterium]|nr:hypothetical protein [Saprospiraceae bacterium]
MRYLIVAVILISFFSCDNTLDILEEPKDIPIVYGILSATDTAHYIRVERAFVAENVSAFELAQDPTQLYYENAEVTLINGTDRFSLEMIDATNDGFPRQEGVFAQTPNTVFKIRNSDINLVEGDEYTLEINRNIENLPLVTATTNIVGASEIRQPLSILNFDNNVFTTFSWREGEFSVIYDLFLDFRYRERAIGSGDIFEAKVSRWRIASDISTTSIDIQGVQFYSFLSGAIPVDDTVERVIESVDLILNSGSTEIDEFIRISDANLGITSSQDIPTFSNLSEGRGIFGSLYQEVRENVQLTNRTLDSIRMGSITGDLNFN